MYRAQVIARQGKTYIVEDECRQQHHCHVRSNAIEAVCGDHVECTDNSQSQHVIENICERKNKITRIDNFKREKTLAANIDHIIIVVAATPTFTTSLIDKYLACAELNQCKASIVINKAELLNSTSVDIGKLESIYKDLTENLVVTSAKLGYGIEQLRKFLTKETSIFVGQSGVGKSSLINRILNNNNIKIGALSENIQQGKHTTTNAYAYNVSNNGKIIDSPGVRTFVPVFKNSQQVMHGFKEFLPYLGHCKFTDCQHIKEPHCAIRKAIDEGIIQEQRYNSYIENVSDAINNNL